MRRNDVHADGSDITDRNDYSGCINIYADHIIFGETAVKGAVLPALGGNIFIVGSGGDTSSSGDVEPVCQWNGYAAYHRGRWLCCVLFVFSEYTTFCSEPQKSGTCHAGFPVESGK